jgi:hypothetical protein
MFNNLFNRLKATLETPSATRPAPLPAQPEQKVPVTVPPAVNRLEAFREEWDDRLETSQEVIEGNGGNTDWAAFTDAMKEEDESFAQTAPMTLMKE